MIETPRPRQPDGSGIRANSKIIRDQAQDGRSGFDDAGGMSRDVDRRLQRRHHATNDRRVVAAVTRLPHQPSDHNYDVTITARPVSINCVNSAARSRSI